MKTLVEQMQAQISKNEEKLCKPLKSLFRKDDYIHSSHKAEVFEKDKKWSREIVIVVK